MSPPLATRIAAPSGPSAPSAPSAPPAPQQEKRTNYRWVVMGLIFCIWAIACADRANFGIALPYMKKEFHITNT
ncbi:hypothetical protein WB334_25845, partial [Escherichia coli]|nr:hypothetical protein [Escherichia coli]